MKPLVSILIPAYNAEDWIADTLSSAQGQTWPRTEIIVVDDGSRDSTLEVARRYAAPNLTVVAQPNQGASTARNYALRLCQGDYIQWLDADDLLDRDKISRQMHAVAEAGDDRILFSSSWGKFHSNHLRAKFDPNSLWRDLSPAEWLRTKMEENLWMSIQSWLISRTLTELAGPWNCKLTRDDDGEYLCRILSHSNRVRFVAEAQSYVRVGNRDSLSHDANLTEAKLSSQLDSISAHIRHMLLLEDTPRARAACLKLLQRWFIYFYPEKSALVERARGLASNLGGRLDTPSLPLKYALIQKLFGWRVAKMALFETPKPGAFFTLMRDTFR